MANTTRDHSTTLAQPAAPDSPHSLTGRSQPTPLVTAGLNKSLKRALSPSAETHRLTGAAALAEQQLHEEERKKQASQMKTPNPATAAKNVLMGGTSEAMSKRADAPSSVATPPCEPSASITNAEAVAEPMQIDDPQASPLTMSPTTAAPPAQEAQTAGASQDSSKAPHSVHLRPEERSNKALTYPPAPAESQTPGPPRGMSLPGSSSSLLNARSPSVKKHKCPHCSTEFTRHHNLKSHLLTHSQEKPFGCQQCSSRFRRLHDLKRHLKLHTGERPHICPICSRKFARGDALARHSKGPGGCAGRRGSAGDEGDEGLDDSMEGVIYQAEGGDSEDASEVIGRRRSEPNKYVGRTSASRVGSVHGSYHHSSSYPPVASMAGQSRSLFPPPQQRSSPGPNSVANAHSSQHLSPKPPSFSSHFNGSSVFSHGGMTESPKPLSPGQHDPHRPSVGSDPGYIRGRSPSLTSQFQQPHLRSGRGTPPMGPLPPPNMSHAPQLPQLPGLAPEPRQSSYSGQSTGSLKPPPVMSSQHGAGAPQAPSSSNHGSGSHHSSGNSAREALSDGAAGQPGQQDASLWEYIRNMERRQDEMAAKLQNQEQQYEGRIQRLQEELNVLRGQRQSAAPQSAASQQPQQQQPQNR